MITYRQSSWGEDPTPTNAAELLQANYNTVYASTFGVVEVGIAHGWVLDAVFEYDRPTCRRVVPSARSPATSSTRGSTSSGAFGGEVLALKINVDFSDAGVTLGTSGTSFGDLTLCNFTTLPLLNGLTVRQFLDVVNTLLGGGSSIYSIADLSPVTADLNHSSGEEPLACSRRPTS